MVRSVRFHRERSDASATTLQAGRERPGSSSHSVVSSASTTATSEAWRKPGKVLRERLVQEDEAHGGKSFTLSPDCPIDRYYRVADKVRALRHCACLSSTVAGVLIMNRLLLSRFWISSYSIPWTQGKN